MNPRDYQNMTLPDLATALGCSFEENDVLGCRGDAIV